MSRSDPEKQLAMVQKEAEIWTDCFSSEALTPKRWDHQCERDFCVPLRSCATVKASEVSRSQSGGRADQEHKILKELPEKEEGFRKENQGHKGADWPLWVCWRIPREKELQYVPQKTQTQQEVLHLTDEIKQLQASHLNFIWKWWCMMSFLISPKSGWSSKRWNNKQQRNY